MTKSMPLITKEAPLHYDAYANLLTNHQRTLLEFAWQQDLSLSEIAADQNITRQAAGATIKSAHQALLRYEEALGLVAREQELIQRLETLISQETADVMSIKSDLEQLLIWVKTAKEATNGTI